MLHMEAQRFETRQTKSACDRGAQPMRPAARSTTLILTARLPAAVAIFDVIASCDPADPVTAASQGKRADSYLRFLDTDGARLCVVHQLFTSEELEETQLFRRRRVGRAADEGRKCPDVSHIVAARPLVEAAHGHVFDHARPQWADGPR